MHLRENAIGQRPYSSKSHHNGQSEQITDKQQQTDLRALSANSAEMDAFNGGETEQI